MWMCVLCGVMTCDGVMYVIVDVLCVLGIWKGLRGGVLVAWCAVRFLVVAVVMGGGG